jgi:hypothetical protein
MGVWVSVWVCLRACLCLCVSANLGREATRNSMVPEHISFPGRIRMRPYVVVSVHVAHVAVSVVSVHVAHVAVSMGEWVLSGFCTTAGCLVAYATSLVQLD